MKRALLPLLFLTVSCGGGSGGGGNPIAPAVLTVETHGGSIAVSTSGCNSGSHNFVAREGSISVRLDASNAASQLVSVQICPGSDIPSLCTVTQQRIAVGQTLSGARNGGTNQTLKFLRQDCVVGSTQAPGPITYAATLTYMK